MPKLAKFPGVNELTSGKLPRSLELAEKRTISGCGRERRAAPLTFMASPAEWRSGAPQSSDVGDFGACDIRVVRGNLVGFGN
jgi:hypothetical protein